MRMPAKAPAFEHEATKREHKASCAAAGAPRVKASLKIVEILPRPNAQTLMLLWDGKGNATSSCR